MSVPQGTGRRRACNDEKLWCDLILFVFSHNVSIKLWLIQLLNVSRNKLFVLASWDFLFFLVFIYFFFWGSISQCCFFLLITSIMFFFFFTQTTPYTTITQHSHPAIFFSAWLDIHNWLVTLRLTLSFCTFCLLIDSKLSGAGSVCLVLAVFNVSFNNNKKKSEEKRPWEKKKGKSWTVLGQSLDMRPHLRTAWTAIKALFFTEKAANPKGKCGFKTCAPRARANQGFTSPHPELCKHDSADLKCQK